MFAHFAGCREPGGGYAVCSAICRRRSCPGSGETKMKRFLAVALAATTLVVVTPAAFAQLQPDRDRDRGPGGNLFTDTAEVHIVGRVQSVTDPNNFTVQ